jgi:hypothetical protein
MKFACRRIMTLSRIRGNAQREWYSDEQIARLQLGRRKIYSVRERLT